MLDKRGTAALRRKQKKERTAFIDSQIPMSLSLTSLSLSNMNISLILVMNLSSRIMNISLKIMRLIF